MKKKSILLYNYKNTDSYKMLTKIRHAWFSINRLRYYSTENVTQTKSNEYQPVFAFPFIKYISILNRLKVYQFVGTSVSIPACGILEAMHSIPPGALLSACYIGITGVTVLTLATLPFKNTIGFLYVTEDNEKVKISFMDFWGRRRDREIPTDDWIPLIDLAPKTMDPIYLSPQLTDGSKYKLFIKFGKVLNQRKMGQVLE